MTEDDYEILPHQLLSDLKYDVEALKKKLTQPDSKTNELILEIESLKDSIHELNLIFEKALQETKEEEDVVKVIHTINEKLETVVTQNETIAKGMIAISDKLEDFMEKQSQPITPLQAKPVMTSRQHSMGLPPTAGPGRVAPSLEIPMEAPTMTEKGNDMPPPPPGLTNDKKARVGIFK